MVETKLDLATLVPYREHQIVSRSLSRQLGIKLPFVIYALDAGESISSEKATATRLLQCVDGVLTVGFADHETAVASGELLVVPADTAHIISAKQRCKFVQMESEVRA